MKNKYNLHESESFSLAIRYSPPGTAISKYYFTGNLELISSSYKTIYSACISAECNAEGEREKGGETTVIMTAVYTGINWGEAELPL